MKQLVISVMALFAGAVRAETCPEIFMRDGMVANIPMTVVDGTFIRFMTPWEGYSLKDARGEQGGEPPWTVDDGGSNSDAGGDQLIITTNLKGILDEKVVVAYNGDRPPTDEEKRVLSAVSKKAQRTILHVRLKDSKKSALHFRILLDSKSPKVPACWTVITETKGQPVQASNSAGRADRDLAIQQAKDTLTEYRTKFHRHEIRFPSEWGGPRIVEAYDDGQFTMVVVDPHTPQQMTLFADVDGHRQIIQADYKEHSERPMWVVHGVFPGGVYLAPGRVDVGWFKKKDAKFARVIREVMESDSLSFNTNMSTF